MNTKQVVCSVTDCGKPVHGNGLCNTHYRRAARGRPVEGPLKQTENPETRFLRLVRPQPNGCWEWAGTHTPDGYALFRIGSRTDGSRRTVVASRWSYEHFVGPIPEGKEADHVKCDNRGCVNFDHIEPATHKGNSLRSTSPHAVNARKTHCPKGHPYTPENTYHWPGANRSSRQCKACRRGRVTAKD